MAPPRSPHAFTTDDSPVRRSSDRRAADVPALALIWSQDEPERVGEVACLPYGVSDAPFCLGRAIEPGEDGAMPLMLARLRPFASEETGPFHSLRVSRSQIHVRPQRDGFLLVEHRGRGGLQINGYDVSRALAAPGDVITATGKFALLYTRRPAHWPSDASFGAPFPFAAADAFGLIGETPAIWELRRRLAFLTGRAGHTLVHGPSGSGKELVVRGLHARMGRGPLIARNAATLPEGLVDAELFGNIKNYPNPGTPERTGLLGEADGGALFLDEIGELPYALQAHLLRVMDNGEYQRLGEAQARRADVVVLAATNRDPTDLKHDLLARFLHHVPVPGLDERADDIPLLARHLLHQITADDPDARARLFVADQCRVTADLAVSLVRHRYAGNTRELHAILWRALAESRGAEFEAPAGLRSAAQRPAPPSEPHVEPRALSREQVLAALEQADGVREKAFQLLGLRSRDQLKRLLKRLDIA